MKLLNILILASLTLMLSCSKDQVDKVPVENMGDQTAIYLDRLNDLHIQLEQVYSGATFGDKKGDYPYSSKYLLEDQQVILEAAIARLEKVKDKFLASDLDRIIQGTRQVQEDFFKTMRESDFVPVVAELQVNGLQGGYIDFGAYPEYSSFGPEGKQAFTVDFWLRLTDGDAVKNSFSSILSTFTDDEANNHERKGWFVNSFFGNLRMSYGIAFSDLFEPGTAYTNVGNWMHIAVVTDENGVDGEMVNGIPVMTKIYVDGVLKLSAPGRDDRLTYTPNDTGIQMVAFTQLGVNGSPIGDKGINGRLKHLHIWKTAKTAIQINNIMEDPSHITGKESDLVCGWSLNQTVSDSQHIVDLTGRYTASVRGSFKWEGN